MSAALAYAAAPLFGLMALVTSLQGDVTAHMLCMGGGGSWLAGMTPMYGLMALVHLSPWLQLMRRDRARGYRVHHG